MDSYLQKNRGVEWFVFKLLLRSRRTHYRKTFKFIQNIEIVDKPTKDCMQIIQMRLSFVTQEELAIGFCIKRSRE